MYVKECKGFRVMVTDERVFVETNLQKFRLRGRGNKRLMPEDILSELTNTSTLIDLNGLLYLRDPDGFATKQVFELVVDNFDVRMYE